MRFAVFFLLVICLVAVVLSASTNTNQKCGLCTDDYTPVCGKAKKASSQERLKTFGNNCVMAKFNCQHPDDQFDVKSNGECGGNVSVLLST